MLSTSRSLLRLTSRASSTAPVGRVFVRLSPAIFPQAYRASLFSSKSTNNPPNPSIDREHEKKVAHETLKSDPSAVTTESSVRHVIEESQGPPANDHDMGAELKHDIVSLRRKYVQHTQLTRSRTSSKTPSAFRACLVNLAFSASPGRYPTWARRSRLSSCHGI